MQQAALQCLPLEKLGVSRQAGSSLIRLIADHSPEADGDRSWLALRVSSLLQGNAGGVVPGKRELVYFDSLESVLAEQVTAAGFDSHALPSPCAVVVSLMLMLDAHERFTVGDDTVLSGMAVLCLATLRSREVDKLSLATFLTCSQWLLARERVATPCGILALLLASDRIEPHYRNVLTGALLSSARDVTFLADEYSRHISYVVDRLVSTQRISD